MTDKDSRRRIIASRIREARQLAGLSQAQAARMLGIHRPSITEAEAARRNISADEISRLAEIYDVSVSWLAGHDTERLDPHDDRLQLAARELSKLKPEDVQRLMTLLSSLRRGTSL